LRFVLLLAASAGLPAARDLRARLDDAVKSPADSSRKFMGAVLLALENRNGKVPQQIAERLAGAV
jgi:hypothetical protein